jgi:hypothetical protein
MNIFKKIYDMERKFLKIFSCSHEQIHMIVLTFKL